MKKMYPFSATNAVSLVTIAIGMFGYSFRNEQAVSNETMPPPLRVRKEKREKLKEKEGKGTGNDTGIRGRDTSVKNGLGRDD